MGAFPADQDKARKLIQASAVTAFLSEATRLMLKTPAEAVSIPTAADNLESIGLIKATQEAVAAQAGHGAPGGPRAGLSADWDAVAEEENLIVEETTAILDAVLESCDGDLAEGVARAVESGRLDVPFSPSVWNAGRVLPVRDASGAVRLAEPAGLPVPGHIRARHRALVMRRLTATGQSLEELIEHDVLLVSRGHFDLWPLS
jgi:methylaspartate mutase epsilon subunit